MKDIFNYTVIINLDKIKKNIKKNIASIKSMADISNQKIEVIIINTGNFYDKLTTQYNQADNLHVNCIKESVEENLIIRNVINYSHGRHILFLDDYSLLNSDFISQINNIFIKTNQNIIKLIKKQEDKDYIIKDLKYDVNNPIISTQSCIIKNQSLLECSDDDFTVINKILLDNYKYVEYSVDELTEVKIQGINFLQFLRKIESYNKLIKYSKDVPLFIQYSIINDLQNTIEKTYEKPLVFEENNKILTKIIKLLENIDISVLTNNNRLNYNIRNFLIFLKNGQRYDIEVKDDSLFLKSDNYIIDKLNRHKLWIDLVDIKEGFLNISGLLLTNFDNKSLQVNFISKNTNKRYSTTYRKYIQPDRRTLEILSVSWRFSYNFDLKINIDELINSHCYFEVEFYENNIHYTFRPEIAFRTPAALSTSSTYTVKNSIMIYIENQLISIKRYSYPSMLKLEAYNLRKIFQDKKKQYKQAILLRLIHVLIYPYMKNKNIWLFNDRPQRADDNAIVLFSYAQKQQDNIKKYYVIDKDTDDYRKLRKEYDNIISRGSFKHKLLYLYSQKNISSFVNEDFFNPFFEDIRNDYRLLYAGLINQNRYFLQHGVTIGDVSNSIKKFNINLSLIVTSSDFEQDSFIQGSYGYDEEIIQTLGLPRYDKLEDNSQKQIVFMPTWRVKLNKDKELFLNSSFYHMVNNILNNKRLHNHLKKKGYVLKFKPHPELIKYIKYFDIKNNVVVSQESYNKLFKESQILITDYSSVAFDFAYLKKPVIYYQPDDDYHYEKGYYNFEIMGFGQIIKEEEKVVDKIITYIDNSCQMEDKYQKRVDKFFKYNDKNNSKRVYEWIYNN